VENGMNSKNISFKILSFSTLATPQSITIPSPFMEPEGSLLFSQKFATCPYLEPDESSLHPHILSFKIHYNIVMDLINALPGNGSVNTFQRATMEAVSQWTTVIARC
jgi:hypothetical protein